MVNKQGCDMMFTWDEEFNEEAIGQKIFLGFYTLVFISVHLTLHSSDHCILCLCKVFLSKTFLQTCQPWQLSSPVDLVKLWLMWRSRPSVLVREVQLQKRWNHFEPRRFIVTWVDRVVTFERTSASNSGLMSPNDGCCSSCGTSGSTRGKLDRPDSQVVLQRWPAVAGLISVEISGRLIRSAWLPDTLYTIIHKYIESPRLIVDITEHHLAVCEESDSALLQVKFVQNEISYFHSQYIGWFIEVSFTIRCPAHKGLQDTEQQQPKGWPYGRS